MKLLQSASPILFCFLVAACGGEEEPMVAPVTANILGVDPIIDCFTIDSSAPLASVHCSTNAPVELSNVPATGTHVRIMIDLKWEGEGWANMLLGFEGDVHEDGIASFILEREQVTTCVPLTDDVFVKLDGWSVSSAGGTLLTSFPDSGSGTPVDVRCR